MDNRLIFLYRQWLCKCGDAFWYPLRLIGLRRLCFVGLRKKKIFFLMKVRETHAENYFDNFQ